MSNQERAAEVIWEEQRSGIVKPRDLVDALADAGLLMPETHEPDNDPSPHYLDSVIVARFGNTEAFVSIEEYDNQEVTPDGEEVYIEVTHRQGGEMVYKTYGKYFNDPSFADARKDALDLLAAIDWIEKNTNG